MITQKLRDNKKKYSSTFNILKERILFLIISIFIFRLGSFIPIPGININMLEKLFQHKNNFLEIFNMFSGGSLSRASIFALGVMPYISASIIVQLLTFIMPFFKKMKKEGDSGKNRINKYTKIITLFFSIIQSVGILIGLPHINGMENIIFHSNLLFYITAITSLVTGTMFLTWMGDLITENGLGNGTSLMICIGIIAKLPVSFLNVMNQIKFHKLNFFLFLISLVIVFLAIFFVVFFEKSQRKIGICYARRQQSKMYMTGNYNNTYLPLKINMSGVMPAIFSSSVLLLISILNNWCNFFFKKNIFFIWIKDLFFLFQDNNVIYYITYVFLIFFFCFFYTELTFDSYETANNLKKSSTFLPGIRPGLQTAKYIQRLVFRLTTIGSFYISFICLLPDIMRYFLYSPFYFGGTSLLIVVVVFIELITQIQTLLISSQYKSILKKSHLSFKD